MFQHVYQWIQYAGELNLLFHQCRRLPVAKVSTHFVKEGLIIIPVILNSSFFIIQTDSF